MTIERHAQWACAVIREAVLAVDLEGLGYGG